MNKVLQEVQKERERQDAKWGEQNHEAGRWLAILAEEFGELAKEVVEIEFCSEREPCQCALIEMRAEAIQVAAVAVAMIECCDRNGWIEPPPLEIKT